MHGITDGQLYFEFVLTDISVCVCVCVCVSVALITHTHHNG